MPAGPESGRDRRQAGAHGEGLAWPGLIVTDDSLVQAIGDIRRAIGDDKHEVVQTAPRRGYRLIAAARQLPPAEPDSAKVEPTAAPSGRPDPEALAPSSSAAEASQNGARFFYRRPLVIAGLVAVVVLAGVTLALRWRSQHDGSIVAAKAIAQAQSLSDKTDMPRSVSPERPPIAVLDFGDPQSPVEDQEIARAYSQELSGELARNADLTVIAVESSFAAGALHQSLTQIARRLGAAYLVTGAMRREGEQLRLQVQLVQGRDGQIVWVERRDIVIGEVYTVRDALVQRIAGSLNATMRVNQDTDALTRPPASLDIYAMTMRGITLKHRFNPKASAEARALLEKVVAQDPRYAPGWLYLGDVNAIDWANSFTVPRQPEMLRKGIAELEKSIELDPRLAIAYSQLAIFLPYLGRHDDDVRAGRRCLELAPSDSDCMIFLAGSLMYDGQPEAALPMARRAMAVDPLPPPWVQLFFGKVLWANRQFDGAIAALSACLEAAPKYAVCRLDRVIANAEAGHVDAARADLTAWQSNVGPQLKPEIAAVGTYGPKAHALIERRLAALQRIQASEAASATH